MERCEHCEEDFNPDDSDAEAFALYCSAECQNDAEEDNASDGYDDGDDDHDYHNGPHFADPGGRSALRAGPRIHPCPTCRQPNRLSQADVNLGYQCDTCADRAEAGMDMEW